MCRQKFELAAILSLIRVSQEPHSNDASLYREHNSRSVRFLRFASPRTNDTFSALAGNDLQYKSPCYHRKRSQNA